MTDPVTILRKGALVRVAGGPSDTGAELRAHAFLDIRHPDGHVERWLGPATVRALGTMDDLLATGVEAAEEFAFDIAVDEAGAEVLLVRPARG